MAQVDKRGYITIMSSIQDTAYVTKRVIRGTRTCSKLVSSLVSYEVKAAAKYSAGTGLSLLRKAASLRKA